jgi:hypothetical protein
MSMQELDKPDMTNHTSPIDWNRKARDLQSIRDTIERHRYSTDGPRKVQALRFAFVIAVAGTTVSSFLRSSEGVAASFLAGGTAYWLVTLLSSLPKTWTELLDLKLASYEPTDIDAYRELQAKSRANYLGSNDLRTWQELEASALRSAAALDGPRTSAFLSKQI